MNALLHLNPEALPNRLTWDKPMPDEEFEAMCLANDFFSFERTREGEILVQAPAGGFSSSGNLEIVRQLGNWWARHRRGRVFDSSCGFFLADGSMLGPDAAYVLPEKLRGLNRKEMEGLLRLCPDFVIELLSPSDRLKEAQAKMESWIANGASLGWLVDPYQNRVLVYRPKCEVAVVTGNSVEGTGLVEGFTLDLGEVWRCYEI
jgi:Uma2 family endonuclease